MSASSLAVLHVDTAIPSVQSCRYEAAELIDTFVRSVQKQLDFFQESEAGLSDLAANHVQTTISTNEVKKAMMLWETDRRASAEADLERCTKVKAAPTKIADSPHTATLQIVLKRCLVYQSRWRLRTVLLQEQPATREAPADRLIRKSACSGFGTQSSGQHPSAARSLQ